MVPFVSKTWQLSKLFLICISEVIYLSRWIFITESNSLYGYVKYHVHETSSSHDLHYGKGKSCFKTDQFGVIFLMPNTWLQVRKCVLHLQTSIKEVFHSYPVMIHAVCFVTIWDMNHSSLSGFKLALGLEMDSCLHIP